MLNIFEQSTAALQPMQSVQSNIFEPKQGLNFLVVMDLATNFIFIEKLPTKNLQKYNRRTKQHIWTLWMPIRIFLLQNPQNQGKK